MSISKARQKFPELVNRTFGGEEFLILKNNIPMVRIVRVDSSTNKVAKRVILSGAFGMWKGKKGKTVDIAGELRKKVWHGSYAS